MICYSWNGAPVSLFLKEGMLGPSWWCWVFWIADDWISFFYEVSMPYEDLGSIRQKLYKQYSLLNLWTIDHEILEISNFNFLFLMYNFLEIRFFLSWNIVGLEETS